MNLKACTFERLAFISLGFGKGAQVEKTSLLEMEFITAQASTLGVFIFYLVRFRPWDPIKTLDFFAKDEAFFTMRSKDSETTHLQAAVRCCVTTTLASFCSFFRF